MSSDTKITNKRRADTTRTQCFVLIDGESVPIDIKFTIDASTCLINSIHILPVPYRLERLVAQHMKDLLSWRSIH